MKKFDISNITVTNIDGIYRSSLATDSEAKARARTSLLIVKKAGRTSYDVRGVRYTADNENILFIRSIRKAVNGLVDHFLFTGQVQQLLGGLLPG